MGSVAEPWQHLQNPLAQSKLRALPVPLGKQNSDRPSRSDPLTFHAANQIMQRRASEERAAARSTGQIAQPTPGGCCTGFDHLAHLCRNVRHWSGRRPISPSSAGVAAS